MGVLSARGRVRCMKAACACVRTRKMRGSCSTSGLDSTRSVMLTICRSAAQESTGKQLYGRKQARAERLLDVCEQAATRLFNRMPWQSACCMLLAPWSASTPASLWRNSEN